MSPRRNVSLSEIRDEFDSAQDDIILQRDRDASRSADEIEDMIYQCPELESYNRAEMARLVRNQLNALGRTGRQPTKVSIDYIKESSPIIDINL